MPERVHRAVARALDLGAVPNVGVERHRRVPPPSAIEATVSSARLELDVDDRDRRALAMRAASAVARPMPEPAPVIIAIRPEWSKLTGAPADATSVRSIASPPPSATSSGSR